MTGPVPAPRLSPMAGFVDALRRYYIALAPAYIAALEQRVMEARQALATAESFAASDAAGYIDRTGVEA